MNPGPLKRLHGAALLVGRHPQVGAGRERLPAPGRRGQLGGGCLGPAGQEQPAEAVPGQRIPRGEVVERHSDEEELFHPVACLEVGQRAGDLLLLGRRLGPLSGRGGAVGRRGGRRGRGGVRAGRAGDQQERRAEQSGPRAPVSCGAHGSPRRLRKGGWTAAVGAAPVCPDRRVRRRPGLGALVAAEGMVLGDLDQDDPDAVRVLDPHLDEAPRFQPGRPADRHAGRREAGVLGGDVAHLQPERQAVRVLGRPAGHLQQPVAEEVDDPPLLRRAELAVDGQPEHIAVERPRPLGIGRAQQDAAAQHLHGGILAHREPDRFRA